jgi:hypothetical protein
VLLHTPGAGSTGVRSRFALRDWPMLRRAIFSQYERVPFALRKMSAKLLICNENLFTLI